MESAVLETLIRLCAPIGEMSPDARIPLIDNLQHTTAPAGRVLFDLDSSCSLFLLICSGAVRFIKPALSGREILLYRLAPGDSCVPTAG